MTFEATRALLQASGYVVRFHEHEWVECLLLHGEEAWLGRGLDRPSALAAALRLALPSALARELFEKALDAETHLAMAAEHRIESGASLAADEHLVADEPDLVEKPLVIEKPLVAEKALVAEKLLLDVVRESAPRGIEALDARAVSAAGAGEARIVADRSTEARPAPVALASVTASTSTGERDAGKGSGGHAPADAVEAAPVRAFSAPRLVRPSAGPPPLVRRDALVTRLDPPHALEELDILMERIRDSREELGLCSPDRQRLAILAWICEARAHTDTFPDDLRIREKVGVISRQLTDLGKTFWPGSVTALQLQMQPRDLPRHILGGPAATWARAAELAERALRSLEYTDERRGFDGYGWADTLQTQPPPTDPSALLESLITEVERYGGSLAYTAVPRETSLRPDVEVFRRWVRQLRWTRGSDVDPDRWARLAGRIRWWATFRDAPFSTVARELDAQYAPEQSWAKELGVEPLTLVSGGLDAASGRRLPAALLEDLRHAMSGKRMVFVSNRRDPDLQTRLADALPSATLDWRVAEPKRLEALGEAIQQGAYDVVLGAIGFQSQGTDHLLARACRLAGVRYVRVNRGRPLACLRALARDLHGAA